MTRIWKVEKAKAQLAALIRQAQSGEVQLITKRGEAAVVVLDAKTYAQSERTGWSTFEDAPQVEEFEGVRPSGYGREIDPL